MYLVYVVCVYIYIIRTQPEWKFSINKNMLLGLILKRTFSIKRNLARALYRSSCRGRWQHHTWCSTLKWIKVTAGNFTPCQWLMLHLMYCQCPFLATFRIVFSPDQIYKVHSARLPPLLSPVSNHQVQHFWAGNKPEPEGKNPRLPLHNC